MHLFCYQRTTWTEQDDLGRFWTERDGLGLNLFTLLSYFLRFTIILKSVAISLLYSVSYKR